MKPNWEGKDWAENWHRGGHYGQQGHLRTPQRGGWSLTSDDFGSNVCWPQFYFLTLSCLAWFDEGGDMRWLNRLSNGRGIFGWFSIGKRKWVINRSKCLNNLKHCKWLRWCSSSHPCAKKMSGAVESILNLEICRTICCVWKWWMSVSWF